MALSSQQLKALEQKADREADAICADLQGGQPSDPMAAAGSAVFKQYFKTVLFAHYKFEAGHYDDPAGP
jgi:hypothetical protein